MRILILGYIIRGPIGGMTWHHLQYVVGLKKLGHDVYFLEDSGDTLYSCYDPVRHVTDTDASYGLKYAEGVFRNVGLEDRWCYFDAHSNCWKGPLKNSIKEKISNAEVLINLSCSNTPREWFAKIPKRILIDTDPVFTQIRNLTEKNRNELSLSHNAFFTFGENFGKQGCGIPDDGFPWIPTRQPVVIDMWKVTQERPAADWTTVMQWDSYQPGLYNKTEFGMKSLSFRKFMNIPEFIQDEHFELALGGEHAPVEELKSNGWKIINSLDITQTPESYVKYIHESKGEWSVAKDGYVKSLSGWFSERSTCYLACGKPVILQDTGFSSIFPTGKGIFAFDDMEGIKEAVNIIKGDYHFQCTQARNLANELFDSDMVLNNILNSIS